MSSVFLFDNPPPVQHFVPIVCLLAPRRRSYPPTDVQSVSPRRSKSQSGLRNLKEPGWRLQLPPRDEKQMKGFETALVPLPSRGSICHSRRLIPSRSAFHHDLHRRAPDERGGDALCPRSSPCQGSGGTEASRTPAN